MDSQELWKSKSKRPKEDQFSTNKTNKTIKNSRLENFRNLKI